MEQNSSKHMCPTLFHPVSLPPVAEAGLNLHQILRTRSYLIDEHGKHSTSCYYYVFRMIA